ncbi:MAG: NlpC/P60 protein, partial [Actinomycetota bacterium]|nr:NlpC/P60 protein [Actinomycetota bacterium]
GHTPMAPPVHTEPAASAGLPCRRPIPPTGGIVMKSKILAGIAAATLILIIGSATLLGVIGAGLVVATCDHPPALASDDQPSRPSSTHTAEPATHWREVGTWTSQQVANAATILSVGQHSAVPVRGWVIAIATAMQESRLRNLPNGDRDSLGLFQQRPSQGWGDTPAGPGDTRIPAQRILDPAYAATRFYTALTGIPGWQKLPLTVAAQAVQHSGFPDAYAKWEPEALALVETVGSVLTGLPADEYAHWVSACVALGTDGHSPGIPTDLPAGFSVPASVSPAVRTAIGWALAQLGTPYSFGGDCTDAHGRDPAHQCDCSSLTRSAYLAAGVTIPRTTVEQSRIGVPIPDLTQLRPGDLVFIPGADGTRSAPGHVGMFLGDDRIIEAPHTGDRVKLVSLQQWTPLITHLRRVIN